MHTSFDMTRPVAIGADHAGFNYKNTVVNLLQSKGYTVTDYGTYLPDSVDYPDFAHPVAHAVETGEAGCGILICGSGNGVAITANKHAGIRAALCWTAELAQLGRQHNNANILCIPQRFVSTATATAMVEAFLHTAFEGGRHQKRVEKISAA